MGKTRRFSPLPHYFVFFLPMAFLFLVSACSPGKELISETLGCRQLLIVKTANWDTIEGKMALYNWNEKTKKWMTVLPETRAVIGKKGMAWGKGLHRDKFNVGKLKMEGDKKNPAGMFYLSPAFGYYNAPKPATNLPYIVNDSTNFCIDDVNSQYYNQIIDRDTVKMIDWKSRERMFFQDIDYKYGLYVRYNTNPKVKQAGSCIFVHICTPDWAPTSGCASTDEKTMLRILELLKKEYRPVLLQVPESAYNEMKRIYYLP
jgi:L,D-peptidoglycan transpeptidase YkuD (ErfK/YbiS/YcfS/YnhG family)